MVYKNFVFIIFMVIIMNIVCFVNRIDYSGFVAIILGLTFGHLVEMVALYRVRSITTGFLDMLTFVFSLSLLSMGLIRPVGHLAFDTLFFIETIVILVLWFSVSRLIEKFFGRR